MALFKNGTKPQEEDLIIKTPNQGGNISKCMVVSGDVVSCESILIEGRVTGNIVSLKKVILLEGSSVIGNIKAKEVRVDGFLEGPIEANIIEVGKKAKVVGYMIGSNILIEGKSDGDILARNTLVVDEGADVTTYEAKAKIVRVSGVLRGEVVATELLEIGESGLIEGDVKTKEYCSSSGSRVTGTIYRYIGGSSKKSQKDIKEVSNSGEIKRVARRVN